MSKLYHITFWSLFFVHSACNAMQEHPALRQRPVTKLVVAQQRYRQSNDASPEQGLACSLHRKNRLPAQQTVRIEINDDDIVDDTAFKQVITTVFAISSGLSMCLACTGIAVLAINSQKN